MQKIDLKKQLGELYAPSSKKVSVIQVPQMNFLMVDGQGDPNTSADYSHAVEALFSLSYTLKFMIKKGDLAVDYRVMPLEGLWWADNPQAFQEGRKEEWKWTAMIMQPEFATNQLVSKAIEAIREKKQLPALAGVRFESFDEGKAAQILHIGPFSEEGPTIKRLHDHIIGIGGMLHGKHHEIYLSDIRRAAPEKWKTIIRQPFHH